MKGEFVGSKKRERAALLVAEDELSDEEIARACGIGKRTLERWKAKAAFVERVAEHHALWRERVRAEGIANRQNRVDALNERWALLMRLVEARAGEGARSGVPGTRWGCWRRGTTRWEADRVGNW